MHTTLTPTLKRSQKATAIWLSYIQIYTHHYNTIKHNAFTHERTRIHNKQAYQTYTSTCTRTHTHTYAHTRTYTHAHAHTRSHPHTHARTHTHTHTLKDTRTHAHTHTHAQSYARTYARSDHVFLICPLALWVRRGFCAKVRVKQTNKVTFGCVLLEVYFLCVHISNST